ncbi:MAG: LacI family DNA-binding transcriptional regulator [Nitrososphaerales archaeon]
MSRTSAKHPTLRDVAALAGVSHQTVSRVVNHVPGVTPETRSVVEQAIARLGFRPHAIARSMAEGRTRTLACLAPNLTDFTYASSIEGAEIVARQRGYFLLSASYGTDSGGSDQQFEALIDALVGPRRVDGLIVISPNVDLPVSLLPADFPVVLMGGCPRADVANLVYLDNRGDAGLATTHLLQLGHTRIGQITGPLREDCSQERDAGYQQALGRAGIAHESALTVEGDWSATSGYEAFRSLLNWAPDITAVVVQNDRMAVGVIRAARDAGLAVPADLSVIGFDDMPLASYFDPPLTTMRQDTFAIGRTCAERLIAILDGSEPAQPPVRLTSELVTRGSTARPANGRVTSGAALDDSTEAPAGRGRSERG